jgi:hypothetical protein
VPITTETYNLRSGASRDMIGRNPQDIDKMELAMARVNYQDGGSNKNSI